MMKERVLPTFVVEGRIYTVDEQRDLISLEQQPGLAQVSFDINSPEGLEMYERWLKKEEEAGRERNRDVKSWDKVVVIWDVYLGKQGDPPLLARGQRVWVKACHKHWVQVVLAEAALMDDGEGLQLPWRFFAPSGNVYGQAKEGESAGVEDDKQELEVPEKEQKDTETVTLSMLVARDRTTWYGLPERPQRNAGQLLATAAHGNFELRLHDGHAIAWSRWQKGAKWTPCLLRSQEEAKATYPDLVPQIEAALEGAVEWKQDK